MPSIERSRDIWVDCSFGTLLPTSPMSTLRNSHFPCFFPFWNSLILKFKSSLQKSLDLMDDYSLEFVWLSGGLKEDWLAALVPVSQQWHEIHFGFRIVVEVSSFLEKRSHWWKLFFMVGCWFRVLKVMKNSFCDCVFFCFELTSSEILILLYSFLNQNNAKDATSFQRY